MKPLHRVRWFAPLVLVAASAASAQQNYPSRPVRFIVPYPPGGSTDFTARELAPRLTELLGQQFVIDNRAGAGSLIGHGLAATAAPDGYTIVLGTSAGLALAPVLGTKMPYDPQKDFAPIGLAVYAPYLLLVPSALPVASVKEFIDYAKKQPGKLNYGSSGTGTPNHLGGELLDILAGTRTVHVPYKGGATALVDLIGGQLQYMFSAIPQVQGHVKSGRLRTLGVGHGTRTRVAPDVPAIAETLPGFNNTSFYGLLAPARTPRDIVMRLNGALNKTLTQNEFVQRMVSQGVDAANTTPEGLGDIVRSETERWRAVIKKAGIVGEAIR